MHRAPDNRLNRNKKVKFNLVKLYYHETDSKKDFLFALVSVKFRRA